MYARRLEQVDDEADELRASLAHRRDRADELVAELDDARTARQELKMPLTRQSPLSRICGKKRLRRVRSSPTSVLSFRDSGRSIRA